MSQLNRTDSHAVAHEAADNKTLFGFWTYLMTDCMLFGSLFATYAVLHLNTNGGPGTAELFSMPFVMVETMLLLTSSFTVGLAMLAARAGNRNVSVFWFVLTFLLGAAFLTLEMTEFRHLVAEGNSWQRSGFLSGYFTLVGTHGLHILVGLLWMAVTVPRILTQGFTRNTLRRLGMLSLFWHFLDIVWIFIFTIVYLMGAAV